MGEVREITFVEALNEALLLEMERDPTIIVMGEDVGVYGGIFGVTKGLLERFGPDRVIDTPISETAFIGAGVGAAAAGLRPVVELMFVDFFGVCMDQIYNQAAKMRYMFGGKIKIPLTIRTTIGGGVSAAAQHSQVLYSIFAHVPGLKVIVPSTPYDAKGLLISAIRDDNPKIFFEHKLLYGVKGPVPKEPYMIPFGVADVKVEGSDVTVVATAYMVHEAIKAADELRKEGVSVEVVDPRTIVPFDKDTIFKSVKKTGRLVVVDEDYDRCGFASWVVALVADECFGYLDAPIKRVTTPTVPIPFSPVLEREILPNKEKIIKAVKEVFKRP
ncbi:MAG: alpha-ketoacid dehydrogenase subunit beta [Sulfolobales archaeon]